MLFQRMDYVDFGKDNTGTVMEVLGPSSVKAFTRDSKGQLVIVRITPAAKLLARDFKSVVKPTP